MWSVRVHIVINVSRFIHQPQIGHISTSVTPALTDRKVKILCSEYLIGVLAFLTELASFQNESGTR